jgi:hypothetical protein
MSHGKSIDPSVLPEDAVEVNYACIPYGLTRDRLREILPQIRRWKSQDGRLIFISKQDLRDALRGRMQYHPAKGGDQ